MHQNFDFWAWFAIKNEEEFYNVLLNMIESKVKELVPQIVNEYLQERKENLSVDIQASINGRSSVDLKNVIAEMILKGQ